MQAAKQRQGLFCKTGAMNTCDKCDVNLHSLCLKDFCKLEAMPFQKEDWNYLMPAALNVNVETVVDYLFFLGFGAFQGKSESTVRFNLSVYAD